MSVDGKEGLATQHGVRPFSCLACQTDRHAWHVQEEGTYHFRTTILVPEKETDEVAKRLVKFHNDFLAKYGEPEQ